MAKLIEPSESLSMAKYADMSKQLPLGLGLRDNCTFESFVAGDNAPLVQLLHHQLAKPYQQDVFIYLWGHSGVGCSHLLQASCQYVQSFGQSALYLDLNGPVRLGIMQDLERLDLVCLDNLEFIKDRPDWQEGLFDFYNRMKAAHKKLIVAAHLPPKALAVELKDLQSRLEWGLTYQVKGLDDEELVNALQLRARIRGIQIERPVLEFLINRLTRSMGSLYQLLDELDKASMALKRKVTIPLVKKIL